MQPRSERDPLPSADPPRTYQTSSTTVLLLLWYGRHGHHKRDSEQRTSGVEFTNGKAARGEAW